MKTYDELKALIEQRGVHAEFGEPGEGFAIEQAPFELAYFLCACEHMGVKSCLEIGTGYRGGLSRFLAYDMKWDVTSVDITNYHHVYEGVHYIVGRSPKLDRMFDLVFIDGDHSYDAVKWDFTTYANLATKAVAFHDILGLRNCEGVQKYWAETKSTPLGNFAYEIIAPEKASGIGYIVI